MKTKVKSTLKWTKELNTRPLAVIDANDVAHTLKVYESQYSRNCNSQTSNKNRVPAKCTSSGIISCSATPVVFKTLLQTSPYRLRRTPQVWKNRLINLSFSQPSTPRTPALRLSGISCATPFGTVKINQSLSKDSFVPSTPMIINPLEGLQLSETGCLAGIPDILQIIDDDSGMDTLDTQLGMFLDVELTDESVIEYLLDLSHATEANKRNDEQVVPELPTEASLRKRRHTKLMSEDERESLRKLQKEKCKQKRKERFRKAPPTGSRRSKRIREKRKTNI